REVRGVHGRRRRTAWVRAAAGWTDAVMYLRSKTTTNLTSFVIFVIFVVKGDARSDTICQRRPTMRRISLALTLAGVLAGFHSNRVEAQSRAVLNRVNAAFPPGVPSSVVGAYVTVTLTVATSGDVTDVQRSNWSMRSDPSSHAMTASEHDRALRLF